MVYNSKLTRALIGAKRDALSDKAYDFSDKEREFFKQYERIATGRDRKRAWSYTERVEALRELYNDNKHYLGKKALNSVKATNSAISEYIGEREVSNKETVYTGLESLNKRAGDEHFNRGFLGAIRKYGHVATGVAAGLLLFVNTSLISPNYISAEEPAQPKKVITIENKEPEKKTQTDEKPIEKPKPEEKKPEEKPVVKEVKKEDFGIQIYNPLQLYKTPSLRLDSWVGSGKYDFRVLGSANIPPPENEKENSMIRPQKLFLNLNGGDENNKSDGTTYNRSFYNYVLGSQSELGLFCYNSGRDRTSRETLTSSDGTKQVVVKDFDAFASNFCLPNGILTLKYSKLDGKDNTKVNVLQPIQLTVKTDVETTEQRVQAGYDHLINKNLSLGGFANIAKADAIAYVENVGFGPRDKILDETWKTWQLGANLYKQNENVAWYLGPNATQGGEVPAAYKWGGDAFLLKPIGKGIIGGLDFSRRDGMNRAGLILGKTPLDTMALYNKRMIDLQSDITLTKEQKELAERDYLKALARDSGWMFELGYKGEPTAKDGLTGSVIVPFGKGWSGAAYGENGAYGTFAQKVIDNNFMFDFGIDRINPENDKGSWTFNVGLSYWFGDGKKQKEDTNAKK